MKIHLASLMFVGMTFATAAIAQLRDADEVPRGEMSRADVDFMITADAANMDQLMLANRASSRARHSGVRSLADNVTHSYRKADDALRLLAGAKHVDLEHRPSKKGHDEADALLDRRGTLDREYANDVAHDGDDIIGMYQDAREHSDDPDVRAYADTMLGALHDLQRQATDLLAREGTGDHD